MKPIVASRILLSAVNEDFEAIRANPDTPNLEYLEKNIERLEQLALMFYSQSKDPNMPPRLRARARDLQQNTLGLINGIKFGISFWLHRDQDLLELETPAEVK